MASDRGGGKWVPPPWHGPEATPPDRAASTATTRSQRPPTGGRPSRPDPRRNDVLALAVVPAATGLVALVFALVPLFGQIGPSGSWPIGLLIIAVLQAVALRWSRSADEEMLAVSCVLALIVSAIAAPLLALQSTLLHEPYVEIADGRATPLLALTLAAGTTVFVAGVWCVVAAWRVPADASIVYAPLAFIVPAMLGIVAEIDERTALETLAESSLLAAGVAVIAWSLPIAARPVLPPLAYLAQVALLWIAGRGPDFPDTSGSIVALVYWTMLILTFVMLSSLPIVAAWLRGGMEAIENEQRPRRQGGNEGAGPG